MQSEKQVNVKNVDELVVNYCITEACNFNCAICYSKWDSESALNTDTFIKQKNYR
jgi:MoaA/NifB/PqqE/SkfB family radical SAM enzyme